MPLASVKLTSGILDTITMRAIGHDYFSIGAMQMYYKDLKVQFLKKGSETKKHFLPASSRLRLIILLSEKSNHHRTGNRLFPAQP